MDRVGHVNTMGVTSQLDPRVSHISL